MRIIPPGWAPPYPDGSIVRGFPVHYVEHMPEPPPMAAPRCSIFWRGPDRIEATAFGRPAEVYYRNDLGFREL